MAIKYEITKHGYAFPTNVLAGKGGEHMYDLLMDKDRANGEVVALDEWQGMQYFSVKEPTGLEAVVLEQADNGSWLVFITKPGDAVIIRQVPEIAEQFTKKFEHEANYYNAKGEIVRGYRAHEGDTWELSADLFDKTPEAKKTLTYAAGKWTVGA